MIKMIMISVMVAMQSVQVIGDYEQVEMKGNEVITCTVVTNESYGMSSNDGLTPCVNVNDYTDFPLVENIYNVGDTLKITFDEVYGHEIKSIEKIK